ncbi:ABC transporter ATP-binding protein [Saccharopolyspora gloriosae]|uniref:ATP-binding cassette domain-containing protein n=1 Tax=Saccharopolyspora gloriosae TaxID=455344 RepID=UPI001FB5B1CE|nr:ABC transporter ATP-binding protein [Saccharopolyspora gloriosae]
MSGTDVVAEGVSVRGNRGPVFENVSTAVEAGGVLLVRGPSGSGRTSLLLALSGRMRFVSGAVRVGEHFLPGDAAAVRETVALARAPVCELEERLRVDDLIAERRWIDRVDSSAICAAFELVGVDVPGRAVIEDLDPATNVLVAVALAVAREPGAVVVDEPDTGCGPDGRAQVWGGLGRVRESGTTLLLSTTDFPPCFPDAVPVVLPQRSADRLASAERPN